MHVDGLLTAVRQTRRNAPQPRANATKFTGRRSSAARGVALKAGGPLPERETDPPDPSAGLPHTTPQQPQAVSCTYASR